MKNMDVSDIISHCAATKSEADYADLFDVLRGRELFFNVQSDGEEGPVTTPLVAVGPGLSVMRFFVSKDNTQLKKPFGGIVWERALEMVARMPQADGMILQNNDAAWVGVDKAKVEELLAAVG